MYITFKGTRGIGRRTGCFQTVRGRIEGNWEEKRLLYSITLQYIIMRSRNRERYLAYGAWKGGAWGIGRRTAVSSQNHAYIHFSLHVRQNHFYSHLLWYAHQNHAYSRLLLHARQSHFLLPPVAITNALLSGLRAQHNYQKSTFSWITFSCAQHSDLEMAGDQHSSKENSKHACESGPREYA